MLRTYQVLILFFFSISSFSYALADKISPKYPIEKPSDALEMVGRYLLTQQNIGTCAKEVTATTRHFINEDGIRSVGITGFEIDRVNENDDLQLRTISKPSGYYDFRLETLDPDMDFRFGNEFALLRCRSFSCSFYPDGQKWILRTFLSRNGTLVINEVTNKTETLDCHYKRTSVPTVAVRGYWYSSLYPESKLGDSSHFYRTNLTVHCSDDGLINGIAKFERMNNGHYVTYSPLSGTCNDGVADIQFTAELENSSGIYEKLTFHMSVGEIETNKTHSFMKGATTKNYSVDVFSKDGKKWGSLLNPFRRGGVSHY